jgi:hypothetical protein
MTIPRFAVIAIACLLFVDAKFDNGRLTDSLEDQAARLGYWLSSEFDDVVSLMTSHIGSRVFIGHSARQA